MNCPLLSDQTADVLLDYAAGRLEPARALSLETHIESCDHCMTFRLEQADLWAALDTWEPEPVSVGFNRAVWQKIDQAGAGAHSNGAPWYRALAESVRFGAWKPVFPVAAAALVIAAGFMFDHPATRPANNGETTTAVASAGASEADQVENTLEELQLLRQFDAASKPM